MPTLSNIESEILRLKRRIEKLEHSFWELKDKQKLAIVQNEKLNQIANEVSNLTGVPIEMMRSEIKERKFSDARKIYFKRAKQTTKFTFREIGSVINKTHGTVHTGIKEANRIPELIKKYDSYFNVKKIDQKLLVPGGEKLTTIRTEIKVPFSNLEPANELPYHGFHEHL